MSTALVIPQNGLVCLATDLATPGRQKCHKLVQAASFHSITVAVEWEILQWDTLQNIQVMI